MLFRANCYESASIRSKCLLTLALQGLLRLRGAAVVLLDSNELVASDRVGVTY